MALADGAPQASALRLLNPRQGLIASTALLFAAASFAAAPLTALIALNCVVTVYFLVAIAFRLWLAIVAFSPNSPPAPAAPAPAEDLPIITVLLPLHEEAEGLPILAEAMAALDYPPEKLDIKLLLEADDAATIAEAGRLGLDLLFDCVVVPRAEPRTKPKACNFALPLAAGELIVIYDAEDAPEADQLRKAAAAFAAGDDRLACVQARLNFYNAEENLLTRLFALEYALWFDIFLPALERLGIPIPLGGTSNFFRTGLLRELGGWDPFNVTEDADLGLRLARRGYRTQILDSTTFEEANCEMANWVRQRSRWMKGYMQTWLVHMREPAAFWRAAGWGGVASLHLFVAGNFFGALVNPILWAASLGWLALRTEPISAAFAGPLLALNVCTLIAGNAIFIFFSVVAPLKRGWRGLAPYALLTPAYWQLTSVGAYKALWQLFTRPSFWEKTRHVLSSAAKEKRRDALRAKTA